MRLNRISDGLLRLEFDVDPTPAQASRLNDAISRLLRTRLEAYDLHNQNPHWDLDEIYRHVKREDGYILNRASVINMIRYNILRGSEQFGLTYRGVTLSDGGICLGYSKRTKIVLRIIGPQEYMFDRGLWCYIIRSGEGSSTSWHCAVILRNDQICSMGDAPDPSDIAEQIDDRIEISESSSGGPEFTHPETYTQFAHSPLERSSEGSRRMIRLVVPNDCDASFIVDGIEIMVQTYQAV